MISNRQPPPHSIAMSPSTIPTTQRAWVSESRGYPKESLSLKEDWPMPGKLERGEVLIRVQAAALNPVGWKFMVWLPNWIARRPNIPELDFTGVIVEENGTEFHVGDVVFGWVELTMKFKTGQGSLSQYLKLPTNCIVKKPDNISTEEAAGVTCAGITAYQTLMTEGNFKEGQSVFVIGGSSSLGAYVIQMAKSMGASRIGASASGKNEDAVRKLGADDFFDYRAETPLHEALTAAGRQYDLIVDAIGLQDPIIFTASPAYLSVNGKFVYVIAHPRSMAWAEWALFFKHTYSLLVPRLLGGTTRNASRIRGTNNKEHLEEVRAMLLTEQIKPRVDSVFEFDDVLNAYERILSDRATGKVVVRISP